MILPMVLAATLLLAPGKLPAQEAAPSSPPTSGDSVSAIDDAQRSSLTFTVYDLNIHLRPADSTLSAVARVTIRNDGPSPLSKIALQLSSSLHWDTASERRGTSAEKLSLIQHTIQTDADHTASASEAVIQLTAPLAPRASTELTLLYSGAIQPSAGALDGVSSSSAEEPSSGWDLISPESTLLRGFGHVLWYPTAAPQIFLGEAAIATHVAGQQLLRQSAASISLRLSVEYTGEAPSTVFFCGHPKSLTSTIDDSNLPVVDSTGIATADFPSAVLGFRAPSLFVTPRPTPVNAALAVISSDASAPDRLSTASTSMLLLLTEWLGKSSIRTLTVLDHVGDPFSQGDLLVAPLVQGSAPLPASLLVTSLTQARFHSAHIWLEKGVPQFMALLWLERTQGREAALAALEESSHPLVLVESTLSPTSPGQSLLAASDAVFYRNKASAVLWALRSLVGDDILKQTLERYSRETSLDSDPAGFENLLHQVSGKDLHWFFEDWVANDRGLPDLSIESVTPRALSSQGAQGAGYLVAVEVRNNGGAAAEVPVTLSAGALTATQRLRIDPHSAASTRILFQVYPQQVQVNDGTLPEQVSSTHVQAVSAP